MKSCWRFVERLPPCPCVAAAAAASGFRLGQPRASCRARWLPFTRKKQHELERQRSTIAARVRAPPTVSRPTPAPAVNSAASSSLLLRVVLLLPRLAIRRRRPRASWSGSPYRLEPPTRCPVAPDPDSGRRSPRSTIFVVVFPQSRPHRGLHSSAHRDMSRFSIVNLVSVPRPTAPRWRRTVVNRPTGVEERPAPRFHSKIPR